jgi:enoyl-CoA hydratase
MQLALTGEPIRAERAYQLGLVNEICETGAALEGAVNLARRICVNLPAAVGVSKAIIVRTLDQTEAEAWETQTDLARTVLRSADALEGASAFADKRSAKWNE